MEKLLFALEEKELEMVSGGDDIEPEAGWFKRYGDGFVELNKGIFFGDGTEGFFAKRKAGVKEAWENMETNGVRAAVVATEAAIPVVGVAALGGVVAGGVYGVKKLLRK